MPAFSNCWKEVQPWGWHRWKIKIHIPQSQRRRDHWKDRFTSIKCCEIFIFKKAQRAPFLRFRRQLQKVPMLLMKTTNVIRMMRFQSGFQKVEKEKCPMRNGSGEGNLCLYACSLLKKDEEKYGVWKTASPWTFQSKGSILNYLQDTRADRTRPCTCLPFPEHFKAIKNSKRENWASYRLPLVS